MTKLIVTIASGDSIDFGDITIPRIYDYAKRTGADFQVLTQPVFGEVRDATNARPGGPSFWKLPLLKWFGSQTLYSHLGFVDVDVYITRRAPDFFGNGQESGIRMCRDMNDAREYPLWKEWVDRHYPGAAWSAANPGYFNAGVWTVDRETAQRMGEALDTFGEIHSRWFEQDVFNLAARAVSRIGELNPEFNHPVPFATKDLTGGSFWHLCGLPQQGKREWLEKMVQAENEERTSL